jgi:fatty acid-binding protein DegV
MQKICIVTDTTAQFPKFKDGWQEMVKILPISPGGETVHPHPPERSRSSVEDYAPHPLFLGGEEQNKLKIFLSGLAYEYQQVFCLLPTKTLFPSFGMVTQTLEQINLPSVFTIIDTRSLGYGLGWLIQTCADFVCRSVNPGEIKRYLHYKIPRIYTLIYLPNLINLSRSKILDPDQAFIGDYLGIHPLVLLENDQIVPYQKARNFKNVADRVLEYAHEFTRIEYVGLHFGISIGISERKNLQNRFQILLSQNSLDTQVMSPYLNHVLGDQSICVILIESDSRHEI